MKKKRVAADMIVISDNQQLHGIGGVMGGLVVAALILKMFS